MGVVESPKLDFMRFEKFNMAAVLVCWVLIQGTLDGSMWPSLYYK